MDINDVLNRAWKIAWNHKVLWVFGFLTIFTTFLMFPFFLVPFIELMRSERPPAWIENPLYILGWLALFGLYMLVTYVIMAVARPAIILGALRAHREEAGLGFLQLLRASLPFFWRFLGLSLLYALATSLVAFVVSGIQAVGSILTMGLASLCLTPLSFLLYPLLYAGLAWLEMAEAAVVADGLGIAEAVRRGWQILRANKMPVFLLILVTYVGLGLLMGVFFVPLLAPFFALPFILEGGEMASRVLWITGLFALGYLPLLSVLQGAVLAFMKSGWLVGYLQLSNRVDAAAAVTA